MENKVIKKGLSVLLSLNMLMGGMFSDISLLAVRAETGVNEEKQTADVTENLTDSENKSVTDTVPVLSSVDTRDLSSGEQEEVYRVGIVAGEEISLRQILVESGFLHDSDIDAYLNNIESVEVSDVDVFTLVEDSDDYVFVAKNHFDSEQTITLETDDSVSYITVTDRSKTPVSAVITEGSQTGSVAVTAAGGERFSDWVSVYADFNWNGDAVNAVTANNAIYADYYNFYVNTNESVGSGYDVSVIFPDPVKGEGYRLFYVGDNYTEEIYGNVDTTGDPNDPVAAGIRFHTGSLGNFVLACTKTYSYSLSQEPYTYKLYTDEAVSLRDVLIQSGMVSEEEANLFLLNIKEVTSDNPEVVKVELTENLECLVSPSEKGFTEQRLTIVMADGQSGIIIVSDERGKPIEGITEAVSYPDDIEIESITISPTEDKLLPEEAESTAEVVEGTESIETVSEEAEEKAPAEAVTEYKVFDIDLENVNKEEYESFDVEVKLSKEAALSGGEFKLYHILDDGTYEEVPVTVNMTTDEYGNEVVDTISFTTPSFSEFVLVYTITTYYRECNGDTWKITAEYSVDAGIPSNAQLSVTEIKEGDEGYETYINKFSEKLGELVECRPLTRAFDISLIDPKTGQVYQPDESVKITIELMNEDLSLYNDIDIVHIHGDNEEQVDIMDTTVTGETIQFDTDGFSVFVVTGTDGAKRRTYIFNIYKDGAWSAYKFISDNGAETTEQMVKDGELPVIPEPVESVTGTNKERTFAGWYAYKESSSEFEDNPYDFTKKVVKNEVVNLYAVFKEYIYVIFHDQYSSTITGFPVADTRRGERLTTGESSSTATVKISDLTTTYNGGRDMAFYGWSYTPITVPGAERDDKGEPVQKITPDNKGNISIGETTHLYPIFKKIKWLSYWTGPTGSGSTYYPAAYYYDGIGPTKMPVPEREGYTFLGWYAGTIDSATEHVEYGTVALTTDDGTLINGASDGGMTVYDGHLHLTDDATIFAKWDENVQYKIVVWRQKTTDTQGGEKSYEFAESTTLRAPVGTSVSVPEAYKKYHAEGETPRVGYEKHAYNSCDGEKQVSDKGDTVLNVYYDVIYPYTPTGQNHTLTFADSVTGEGASTMPTAQTLAYNAAPTVPTKPASARSHYSFGGWYADPDCTIEIDLTNYLMPDHDVTVYAGWNPEWFLVKIDPNYGAMYSYNDSQVLTGTGSTWFWEESDGQPIQEYQNVTRDYVESSSGTWYYVNQSRDYYGYPDEWVPNENTNRKTYYTQNPDEATEYTTFEYEPNVYHYAGWYEVNSDGSETPYEFGQIVDHNTTLRLHWKKVGVYYLKYDAKEGTLDTNNSDEEIYAGLDQSGYVDNAEVVVTRTAIAPAGFTFVGWKVRGDSSNTVYTPGEAFRLLSDYAVSISGKQTVTLEAVYEKLGTAKIIYDFNGGTFTGEGDFDFGAPIVSGSPETIKSLASDKKSATVSNIVNNSNYRLSNGANVTFSNATLKGWSSSKAYDATKDTLFALDGEYGIDTNEPVTLYAVWELSVSFNLNKEGATWTGTSPVSVYKGNPISEPSEIPTCSGSTDMFRYWVSASDSSDAYDFSTPVMESKTLYAYWSGPIEVPVHAVDSTAETLVDKDSAWLKNNAKISVGTDSITLNGTTATNYMTSGNPPAGYVFGFAVAHKKTDSIQNISADEAVTNIYYNQNAKHLYVKYADTSKADAPLNENYEIYFVYYENKTLNISYKGMAPSGELNDVTVNNAPGTITLNDQGIYNVTGTVTGPKSYLNDSTAYKFYAYAVGKAGATDASYMTLITDSSEDDNNRPNLTIHNTWRGYQYSIDGTTWVDCGYAPVIYVLYFAQKPTIVTFKESTVGSSTVLSKEFKFNLIIKEYTEVSVLTQEFDGTNWVDKGTTTNTTESDIYDTGNTPYNLSDGEAQSAILFYSQSVETSGESVKEGVTTRTVTTTTKTQKATITQTPDKDFDVTVSSEAGTVTQPNKWEYTSDAAGGTKNATFTNTHKVMTIEVHVARIEAGKIYNRDNLRSSDETKYTFVLPINSDGKVLEKLPADNVYKDATGTYDFGAVVYGSDGAGSIVSLEKLGIETIAYEKNQNNKYELQLKDSAGKVIGVLGDNNLYYLYYPMPQLKYVKQSGEGNDASLTTIRGSLDGTNPDPRITYNRAEISMNGVTVVQDQRISVPQEGLLISQESSSTSFKMPPILDDEIYKSYLSYSSIGVGSGTVSKISDLNNNVNADKVMRLRIHENQLEWSFDGVDWYVFSESQTIYAIYTERGYDLEISKEVDTSQSGPNPIFTEKDFTVTISSAAITKNKYEAEGAATTVISATPAEGSSPGSIVLSVRDGSKIKIKGLSRGDYTITESNNENFDLTAQSRASGGNVTVSEAVTENSIELTLDAEKKLKLINTPKAICKIVHDGQEHLFYTIQDAIVYVQEKISSHTATIEMLVDYLMPKLDLMTVPENSNITLTTATSGTHRYQGSGRAQIIRSADLALLSMITNNGELELINITVDGKGVSSSAPMIQSAGSLTINRGTTLRNATSTGNGGAINASGNISIIGTDVVSLSNNTANKGGLIYYTGAGTITISGGTISGNNAVDGAVIYAEGGTVSVSGGTISGNTATNGGAIYAEYGVVSFESGASVSNNNAENGGAVYADSGTVDVKGGTVTGNSASTGNGGAIYSATGTVNISGGSLSNNNATSGYGGAVYSNSGTVSVSGGTMGSNSAINGAAVFVNAGNGNFSGGSITGNIATSGGAVGVGLKQDKTTTSKLYFSGNTQITGNTMNGIESNVYLNVDSDAVINAAGLGGNALIGIYVPDQYDEHGEEYLFKNRGDVGAKFGTYTNNNNANKFINDRQPNLHVTSDTVSLRLIWGKAIKVEVKYLANYSTFENGFPPKAAGTSKYTNNDYYPTKSDISISEIGEDLREKYNISLGTAVYGTSFVEGATTYSDYITRLVWEDTEGDNNFIWKVVKRDGTKAPLDTSKKIVIYYSEPAYISIENNTEYKLTIDPMTVLEQSVIKNYGLVFAKNGAIQEALLPVQGNENNKLILNEGESIIILVPGGRNQSYNLKGKFDTTSTENIQLRRTGVTDPESVVANTEFELNGTTLNNGENYEIIFGDDKYICKIVDSNGENRFSKITKAVEYANLHQMSEVTIEMLVDYLMPATDVLEVTENDTIRNLTLTTAKSGQYRYSGNRATISRASGNLTKPLVTIMGKSGEITMSLNVHDLDFDGKSLAGKCDGGAIKTKNTTVTINNSDYKNFIALNGGAVFVSFGDERNRGTSNEYNFDKFPGGGQYSRSEEGYDYEHTALLTISAANFKNCESLATKQRCGGGAIWTNARTFTMDHCNFDTCKAIHYPSSGQGNKDNQGGAVFHRIDSYSQKNLAWQPYADLSATNMTDCSFANCIAMAGGGMETDAHYVNFTRCDFTGCSTKSKDGGAFNIYIYERAYAWNDLPSKLTLDTCTFISCTSARNGGAVRSLTVDTDIINCNFVNTTAKEKGGAICITNTSANSVVLRGTTIEGSTANNGPGGAIYTESKQISLLENTVISNCKAKGNNGNGGAVSQLNGNNGSFTEIVNSTIDGCIASQNGGGYFTSNSKGLILSNSTISNCTAENSNGGGICYDTGNGIPSLDNSYITGNTAKGLGGGIYTKNGLNLNNSYITENRLSTNTAENAAGVYIPDNKKLTVGDENKKDDKNYRDNSSIMNNTTQNGTSSNLRLSESNGVNKSDSVKVNCNLGPVNNIGGYFGVVNAKNVGTQFGSAAASNPDGFSEKDDAVFQADNSTLYGIIDRKDASGKKIIWAGPPICKITDGDGNLLYFKNNESDPAIFDVLEDNKDRGRTSAFSTLRQPPNLYYKDGTKYTGTTYSVKMLVERYELDKQITMVDSADRTIILTTAGKNDKDGYPLESKASGNRATIIRSGELADSMIVATTNFQLNNILLDGNNVASGSDGGIIAVKGTKDITVDLQSDAILQGGKAANGGAVSVENGNFKISGGLIRLCEATANGGAVYMNSTTADDTKGFQFSSGNIQNCKAVNGAGVYLNDGVFNMSGGTISGCNASGSGGGVFVANGKTMYMGGGFIGYEAANTAVVSGGGIAVGGEGSRLNFYGQVNISKNTCEASEANGKICNVELNLNTKEVINTIYRDGKGLYARSIIGVYVPGNRDDENPENDGSPYKERGGEGDPFGTFTNEAGSTHLHCFINDRNGLKGGLIASPEANTIYWIKIFSIEISKEVQFSENLSYEMRTAARNQDFSFTVRLWDTDDNTSGIKVADIAKEIAENYYTEQGSKYGSIPFAVTSDTKVISATITLKDGEMLSSENLPDGLGYDVTEAATSGYVSIPVDYYSGHTGENKDKGSTGINPYVSVVNFTNMLPVCKITDTDGHALYYVDSAGNKIPAVYMELKEAFTVINEGRTLYKYPLTNSVSYAGDYHIEMLVPDYTLPENLQLTSGRTVTFKTADLTAGDNFPFRGTGVASVKRSTTEGTMLTLSSNSNIILTNIKLDGNKVEATVDKGGLVYVPSGGKLTVTDGAMLQNSRITGNGAGVYLEDGSTLYLSGNPVFGGTDTDYYGYLFNEVGNFKISALTGKKNGGKNYTYEHQDIYLAEAHENAPASIVITGDLRGENGSIWVWADSAYHNKTLMPFAKLADGVSGGNLAIFRNARDDETSENATNSYLFGTDEGDTPGYVYWSGEKGNLKVVLRKHDADNKPLSGARMNVYKGEGTSPYSVKDENGNIITLDDQLLVSGTNGVFWIGMLPYGTYILQETTAPAGHSTGWFYLIVDETGIYEGGQYVNRDTAKHEADVKNEELKQSRT